VVALLPIPNTHKSQINTKTTNKMEDLNPITPNIITGGEPNIVLKENTFLGAVYFLNLDGEKPFALFKTTEWETEQENWLVELLVRLFPDQKNFGWNGCHVVMTGRDNLSLENFKPEAHSDDTWAYTCDEIHQEFRDNPKWKNLEQYSPV
jgi:hypothetical protein